MTDKVIIPVHEWTNGGDEVLVVRCVPKDGKTYGGFQNPMTVGETVTAPDWGTKPPGKCGGGIHGWAWGLFIGEGKDPDWSAVWQVYGVKPADIQQGAPDLIGKIKFRSGILRFVGTWDAATAFILSGQMAWVHQASDGTGKATGDRSASSATGYSSASSATGKASAAVVTGKYGKAKAGEFGCIALAWYNEGQMRYEMRCALTGEGQQCKADVWYTLDDNGNFIEA